jgi:hypothetical protein
VVSETAFPDAGHEPGAAALFAPEIAEPGFHFSHGFSHDPFRRLDSPGEENGKSVEICKGRAGEHGSAWRGVGIIEWAAGNLRYSSGSVRVFCANDAGRQLLAQI